MKQLLRTSIFAMAAVSLLPLAGCHSTHAPTVDVLGSYFPAWIICILSGLVLTVLTRQILLRLKVAGYLHPAPVVYLCLQISFTLLVWLIFFKN